MTLAEQTQQHFGGHGAAESDPANVLTAFLRCLVGVENMNVPAYRFAATGAYERVW
jgi:hypothetical protein